METSKASGNPIYEGEPVIMGGKEWILPPLSFRQLRQMENTLETIMGAEKKGFFARFRKKTLFSEQLARSRAVIKIIHAALSRNYPKLKLSEVEDMIDNKSLETLVKAVMGITGLNSGGQKARSG
jgi:hypothetical protein